MEKFEVKNIFFEYKDIFFKSKKYWIIYLILILFFILVNFEMKNFLHPKMEILIMFGLAIAGIFCIVFSHKHKNKHELYKLAFVIILLFGVLFSFLTPICCTPDEIEHFVRAEMTSSGVIFPEYENDSFLTIQSILDLVEVGKEVDYVGYEGGNFQNSIIFMTDADTQPINYSLVEYPSAFAQNPFYGYLAPALGILIAKLFNLNSIWLLWLGRIFNVLLYAGLVSLAVKKTPILKMPLLVFACFPMSVFLSASVSIDALINGLGILTVAYFFYLFKLPKNSLNRKHLIKFSLLVLILGTCKITFFAFILLLLFIPKNNIKIKNYYIYCILIIIFMGIFAALWSKFYVDPGFMHSWRHNKVMIDHINSTEQIQYILSHKKETFIEIFHFPQFINNDLVFSLWEDSIYLMFLGAVSFLYPHQRYDSKTRRGALLVSLIIYFGTYFTFLISWTEVGAFNFLGGIQPRYFYPMMALIPFIFGFNYVNDESHIDVTIDSYIILFTISFIALTIIRMTIPIY